MSNMLREQYLSSIVVQDQAFFDRIGPGEIVTRASKDIDSVRTGLGERLGYLVWSFSSIVAVSVPLTAHRPDADNSRHSSPHLCMLPNLLEFCSPLSHSHLSCLPPSDIGLMRSQSPKAQWTARPPPSSNKSYHRSGSFNLSTWRQSC